MRVYYWKQHCKILDSAATIADDEVMMHCRGLQNYRP